MFTASMIVSEALDCSSFTIEDSSSYASEGQGTFVSRSLTITNYLGETIDANGVVTSSPSPIVFDFANYPTNTITIPSLKDCAYSIKLTLLSSSPQVGSVYSIQTSYSLVCRINNFAYSILQNIAANPKILNDKNLYDSLNQLYVELDNVAQGVKYSDLTSAQSAIDRANALSYFQLKKF
ncbi:MAG: hypothetical protein JSS67_01345 [Bacteroidetes bacterium]|nr:hypothetical protein [Bacteroidota bacterium]